MPLINGMKMACEPCIRGHRSTKCTHANERLMVPVRKPGRPLSVCPHPPQQACGCGSVTAAIPRKQTCHCGSAAHAPSPASNLVPGPEKSICSTVDQPAQIPSEALSPTKVAFKVQKSSRPSSSRKQPFDPANFERMDMNQVNMLPYEQWSQNTPVSMPNRYIIAGPTQGYAFPPQYANMYDHVPLQPVPDPNSMSGNGIHPSSTNGYTSGINGNGGLEHVAESPLAAPTTHGRADSNKCTDCGQIRFPETPTNGISGDVEAITNGGSCCVPQQKSHSHNLSTSLISDSEKPIKGSCSSETEPGFDQESISKDRSAHATPHILPQMLPPNGINGMQFNAALYPSYGPQHTIFTYPATYGSFQNPLQPSAWRESVRTNNYSLTPLPSGPQTFDALVVPATLDTVHQCSCGDNCQCIGCLAHPYNDATQEYVESAWASMKLERPASEQYDNHQASSNGNKSAQPPLVDHVTSPNEQTPASSTSGNDEEPNLSAADFFFVSYPFTADDCGGDTQSCPCGDDCECLGCTIHRQPAIPCDGDAETCPCGADCQCIGCSIHNNGLLP